MRIYLVRHGESEGNIAKKHQPETSPLSLEGLRQADKLAARFEGTDAKKIVASPLVRTKQTAEAIAKVTGLEIEFDDRIKELKRPSMVVGRSASEPEISKIWQTIDSHAGDPDYHFADEENFYDLKKRISDFITHLTKRDETDLIVVSHGYAIRTFIGTMVFGDDFDDRLFKMTTKHMNITNTAITICDYDGDDGWRISTVNDVAHLLD